MSTERRWRVRRPEDFGRALAEARHDRRLTQADVAEQTGIERSYIARLENGRVSVMLGHLLRALRAVGADITITWNADRDA